MTKFNRNSIVTVAIVSFVLGITGPIVALAATDPGLGGATTFSALGATSVTNTGVTTLSGDIGVSPGISITNVGTLNVGGATHNNDGVAGTAQANLATANGNMLGQGLTSNQGPALDGLNLTTGVYDIGAGRLNGGVLTLNGPGIYIFRTSSDFISSGSINFINGARPCDLFWSVNTLATINGSSFAGTIIAGTGVHFGAGVTLDGRALAIGGDVTMIGDTISGPSCVIPTPVPTAAGQTAPNPAPLISVIKVPTPLALPFGPGSVTYDYTVLNIGVVPMSNITVTDNKCSTVNFILGDSNVNSKLDVDETWKYSCTTTLAQTTTNIVTATGQHDFLIASDTAEATVVVGVPVVPPLIHVVKKPSVFVLPAGGGLVTYTYTVTNPGTAPLSDVSVADDKCTGLPDRVVGHPGDLNKNNLLESDEVWSFTCQSNLTQTTTNIGTAKGSANGLTATDFSTVTVVVSAPVPQVLGVTAGFPNTGFPPQDNSNAPWNVIIPTGILIALFSAYSIRKKQVI